MDVLLVQDIFEKSSNFKIPSHKIFLAKKMQMMDNVEHTYPCILINKIHEKRRFFFAFSGNFEMRAQNFLEILCARGATTSMCAKKKTMAPFTSKLSPGFRQIR